MNWVKIAAEDTLHIYGEIGSFEFFQAEIREWLESFAMNELYVRIDSIGGNPNTAFNLYAVLKSMDIPTHAIIENACMSAATLVACGCDKVTMSTLGTYLIHENSIEPREPLSEDELAAFAEYSRITNNKMARIYSAFTGIEEPRLRGLMKKTLVMSADEALRMGFVNNVQDFVHQIEEPSNLKVAASAYNLNRKQQAKMSFLKKQRAGASLAARLNELIDEQVNDNTDRSEIISRMASAAGIEPGTVNQILNGSINCPPIDRLEGFAEALGTSLESLTRAGNRDGCNYNANQNARSTMDWTNKIKSALNLGDSSDEADVVISAKELKAKADRVEQLEQDLAAKDEEITSLKAQIEELEGEQPSEEELAEQAEQEVEDLIEAAVKEFRIAASAKDAWKEKFSKKPDELKATLELIPKGTVKGGGSVRKPKSKAAAAGRRLNDTVAADFGIEQ